MSTLVREDAGKVLRMCGRLIKNVPSSAGFQRQSITLINICRILDAEKSFPRFENGVETLQAIQLKKCVIDTHLVVTIFMSLVRNHIYDVHL